MASLLWKGQIGALTLRASGAGAAKASKADVEAQVGSPVQRRCPVHPSRLLLAIDACPALATVSAISWVRALCPLVESYLPACLLV